MLVVVFLKIFLLIIIDVSREFEVDSINFAGQVHRWRLSWLLQRGRDRRRETLLTDLALATRFIVVTARSRLVSHCFSVSQSCKAFLTGLLRLLGKYFVFFCSPQFNFNLFILV